MTGFLERGLSIFRRQQRIIWVYLIRPSELTRSGQGDGVVIAGAAFRRHQEIPFLMPINVWPLNRTNDTVKNIINWAG